MGRSFRESIVVRYGEVDAQRVVFNAHYLAYCDHTIESWFRSVGLREGVEGWDFMLKRAVVEWASSATIGDVLDIEVGVDRWGNTSFDVGFAGSVRGEPVFTATITYVGVVPGTKTTMAPPESIKALLSAAAVDSDR